MSYVDRAADRLDTGSIGQGNIRRPELRSVLFDGIECSFLRDSVDDPVVIGKHRG
ncbi:hypothetical protein D3C73_1542970 [compost metagenome]